MSRYSHVDRAPGIGGTEFEVRRDEGARFQAPFRALVWSDSDPLHDNPLNWVELDILEIDDDTMRFNGVPDFTITSGMRVAEIRSIDAYDLDEVVHFAMVYPYDSVIGEDPAGSAFGGSLPFSFTPEQSGVYAYRFESESGSVSPDHSLFVRYTAAQ